MIYFCQMGRKKKTKNPDDKWYGGSYKYKKGAGKKIMQKAVREFEKRQLLTPDWNRIERGKYLKSLCKVD